MAFTKHLWRRLRPYTWLEFRERGGSRLSGELVTQLDILPPDRPVDIRGGSNRCRDHLTPGLLVRPWVLTGGHPSRIGLEVFRTILQDAGEDGG
jgi:hypothetical protein